MIDFDYDIERDEGDEIKNYFPNQITSPLESSTAYIEGPNSSGKSTLLHLMALGFYGLEDGDLARPLREKLEDLINNDKILFDISIKDDKNNVILQTKKNKKDDDEILTYHNKGNGLEELDSEAFEENYKLIYDIPDNPTERIDQIANDVKYSQTSIANGLSNFSNYVRDILTEITEGRDPNRISKLSINIEGQKSNLTMLKNQAIVSRREFELLCKYAYPRLLQHYTGELSSIKSELIRIESSAASKRKAKSTSKNKYDSTLKEINEIIKKAQREYREIDLYLNTLLQKSEEETRIKDEWKEMDFIVLRTEYYFPEEFLSTLEKIEKIIEKIYSKNKSSEQKANVYSQIIGTLQEATSSNIKMPEMGKTLAEFISDIEKLRKKTLNEAIKSKNAKKAIDNLNHFSTLLNSLKIRYFPKILELSEATKGQDPIKNDQEIIRIGQGLQLEKRNIKAKIKEYKHQCAKYEVSEFEHADIIRNNRNEIEKFLNFTEEQLSQELIDSKEEKEKSKKQYELAKLRITRDEEDLERLEQKKPHKFENKKDSIENLMNYLNSLERTFLNTFSKTLDSYKQKKALPSESAFPKDYKLAKEYYDGVSRYLGTKLGTIRHIDGEYTVIKVNLVSGNITTDSGKKIRLRSMGTGQTQSTYLQSKLKTNYGKRKLIVMFDEVGMMDDNSMEPIKNMIKNLKEEEKLLVGLVVQRLDSGVKITPI